MNTSASENFIESVQQRVAQLSVGSTTVRSMGPEKTAESVRKFLGRPRLLKEFASTKSEKSFLKVLDQQTSKLRRKLPAGAKIRNGEIIDIWGNRWGVARKCLNIFLYECTNNRWLCETYPGLLTIVPLLEVPLDSYVGRRLHKEGATLPWKNVIGLTKQQSRDYQEFAREFAERKGIHRVHLDLEFFTRREK